MGGENSEEKAKTITETAILKRQVEKEKWETTLLTL